MPSSLPTLNIFNTKHIEEFKMSKKAFQSFASLVLALAVMFAGVTPAYAAPSNDNFADATLITSLPFNVNSSNVDATFEFDEPTPSCWFGYPQKTVWFAYTASSNSALTVKTSPANITPLLAVYTGSSINTLAQVGCQYFGYDFTFVPQAGQTYYFQLGGLFGDEGNISFTLDVTPPPQVQISYNPSDPNIFENVSFYPYINDPIGCCSSVAWVISDGTTSSDYSFSHQFAADGDYTVNVTATTSDGRTGLAPSQVIQVRTRDVAISKFSVPQTARVNQTKTINVDVKNNRYSDYVQVIFFKGLPGGGEQVIGILTLYVPAKAKQATTFKFSYTFTPDDAAIGKVTFKAVATIVNGRDAFLSDNTSIVTTTVNR